MLRPLNPLKRFLRRPAGAAGSGEIYGVIVAQARLPAFYRAVGVPDTLEGRFSVLTLHLFAVLHRIKSEGAAGRPLAQDLMDRFSKDIETVLRELGVSDLKIPKKMRALAGSSLGQLETYEVALGEGSEALQAAIAAALPLDEDKAEAVSVRLAVYLQDMVRALKQQSPAALNAGQVFFPEISA